MSSNKPKVLFLNPPGERIYIRDYYCSKVSKAYYYPQPVDLLLQTSYFQEAEFDVQVIDCIAENVDQTKALDRIDSFQPQFVIALLGAVSLEEDLMFYQKVKANHPEVKFLASGDALLENHSDLLKEYKWLDAIITNFFLDGPKRYILGERGELPGLVHEFEGTLIQGHAPRISKLEMGVPRHNLFQGNYRMPFANALPMATVLTNYACPYPCTFCIMSTMPYTTRSAASIIAELQDIKEKGYRYIYFSDQTFFQSRNITKEVLQWMIDVEFDINWMCFSRVDVLDEEELRMMKKAGCNLIMFGVEWADDYYLKRYKKNYTLDQIRTTFRLSKELGIKRLGTFLIGVPGQTRESIEETVQFAKDLDADYASFNVAVPRSNTAFRQEAIEANIIDDSVKIMDQSGDKVTMGTGELSRDELQALKQWANRSFYLRTSYLLKRVAGLSNFRELIIHLKEGWFMLRSQYRS